MVLIDRPVNCTVESCFHLLPLGISAAFCLWLSKPTRGEFDVQALSLQ